MTSKEMNILLISAFPELKKEYDEEISWQEGDDTGSHVVYGDIFSPWIIKIFKENNEKVLVRIFDFIESSLSLNDRYVEEVLLLSILENLFYEKHNGWNIVDYYVDDGISGTTYDRPGFEHMIEDIEGGKINLVITKDLSRLGRDYLKTGYYTEVYFGEMNVRYIALNDGIDTIRQDNDIAPFKNILNEMYAKDISRKIKSAYKIKAARGDHQGAFAPFGYKKHPEIKGKILIDEESSKTIRLIFQLAKQGNGAMKIRNELVRQKVLTPSAYLHQLNPNYFASIFQNAKPNDYYSWTIVAIQRILENEIYIGNITHYKEISVSYKTKKRQLQPREKWVTIEGNHEPIIEKEVWDLVHDRMKSRAKSAKVGESNMFARIVRCAACGWSMWLTTSQINRKTRERTTLRYFQCCSNRQFGTYKCSLHNTSYKDVYHLILNDIHNYARLAMKDERRLFDALCESGDKQQEKLTKTIHKELQQAEKRLNDLEILLERLFEENVARTLNADNYTRMFGKYQEEQDSLKIKVSEINIKLQSFDQSMENTQKWIKQIRQHANLKELNAPIINELIEKILIHESEKINGKRVQTIDIYYRFIGNIQSCINLE